MSFTKDIKTVVADLENKIQKLISLQKELVTMNQKLMDENQRLVAILEDERNRLGRLEEGYKNLKEVESGAKKQQIAAMKRRINDIIAEIDKNMSMIDNNK